VPGIVIAEDWGKASPAGRQRKAVENYREELNFAPPLYLQPQLLRSATANEMWIPTCPLGTGVIR
jgi:hypothetical protein